MWGVLAELEDAWLVTLADKGYQGSTYAKIPYKGKNKPDSHKQLVRPSTYRSYAKHKHKAPRQRSGKTS